MELGINPHVIHHFIEQARAYHAKDTVFSDDLSAKLLSNQFGHVTYHDAVGTINKLDPEQQAALVALMYVGRGDFDISEWDDALAVAKNYWTDHTGEYLLSRPLVANYLEEGLEQLTFVQHD